MIVAPINLEDLQYFSPLCVTQLIDTDKIPKYLLYPLKLINVFEIGYWLILTYGVTVFTNIRFARSLKVVASSYGVALLIWVVFIVFVQVQYS